MLHVVTELVLQHIHNRPERLAPVVILKVLDVLKEESCGTMMSYDLGCIKEECSLRVAEETVRPFERIPF
ncbi:hypothetical protein PPNSA23_28670 [Phyllobacterium phragmitis]|uniref:Uncharacterized protein n=1 Tax=Phyllobacterium phragmitis TaxID=2670329 RepID=A0ABQ0H1Y9_9HYPH